MQMLNRVCAWGVAADAPLEALSREQKLLLLKRLRAKLRSLAAMLAAKQGPSSASEAVRSASEQCQQASKRGYSL